MLLWEKNLPLRRPRPKQFPRSPCLRPGSAGSGGGPALKSLDGIDVAAFLLDASAPFGRGDEWVISEVSKNRVPKILVLSKIDLVNDELLDEQRHKAVSLGDWDEVVEVSSLTGAGIDDFIEAVVRRLPTGPLWFPADMETDQPLEVIIAEFIREKILLNYEKEIPYSVEISIEEYKEEPTIDRISAVIYVARDSQKGILIGHQGSRLKKVGSEARADLEQFLGKKVFLQLFVKVNEDWRNSDRQLKRFGYEE